MEREIREESSGMSEGMAGRMWYLGGWGGMLGCGECFTTRGRDWGRRTFRSYMVSFGIMELREES